MSTTETTGLDVRPMSRRIGAEVRGVDLADLDDGTFASVHRALLDHQVLFFRDQHLDDEQHLGLTRRWGEPMVFPVARLLGGSGTLSVIEDTADSPPDADGWHTDVTWVAEPPKIAVLAALTIPPGGGGDTMWSSSYATFEDLSEPMQRFCEELTVLHTAGEDFVAAISRNLGPEIGARVAAEFEGAVHPLVRTHDETGRQALFLSRGFVRSIVGLHPAESDALLAHLDSLADDPNRVVRWHWREGDVAVWDERCTQHRALSDHFPQHRAMRRATVVGERPEHRRPGAEAPDLVGRPA